MSKIKTTQALFNISANSKNVASETQSAKIFEAPAEIELQIELKLEALLSQMKEKLPHEEVGESEKEIKELEKEIEGLQKLIEKNNEHQKKITESSYSLELP